MKYLISGGGTGGHIYPAIAIADRIRETDSSAEILFVGAVNGLGMELVPKAGYRIQSITVSYLKRKISWHNIKSVRMLIKGLIQAKSILDDFRPDWVIGTGGYVSGPVVYQAAKRNINTLIHEQNAFPGLTNRILSRYVKVVALSFEEAGRYFRYRDRLVVTGNPIRKEYYQLTEQEGRDVFPEFEDSKMVLVAGGSRGSSSINQAVLEMLNRRDQLPFRLFWSTGKLHYEKLKKETQLMNFQSEGHQIVPYINRMPYAIKACDLIVTSAGAITIAEVQAAGKYAILVPKAYTAENHQEKNAQMMETEGYASVIREQDLTGEILYQKIIDGLLVKHDLVSHTKVRPAVDRIWSLLKSES